MAIEIYRHKRRKPFIPDKTSFTRKEYQIIGWNEYDHRFNTTPDYLVDELTPKGFPENIDLYACWSKDYDNLVDDQYNDIMDEEGFDIEISK